MNQELGIKKKRYWLWGGIIAVALFLLSSLMPPIEVFVGIPAVIFASFFRHLIPHCNSDGFGTYCYGHLAKSLLFLCVSLAFFVTGSVVGWIYGKIKNRKSSQLTPKS